MNGSTYDSEINSAGGAFLSEKSVLSSLAPLCVAMQSSYAKASILDASQTMFEFVPAKLNAHPAESKSDEIFVSLTIVLNKIQKYYFIITTLLEK